MGVVTVIVTGIPLTVSVAELAKKFDTIFDTNNIGTFRVRDIMVNRKRNIAIDFESGFDAMMGQELIDKYVYEYDKHSPHILRAKITKEPALTGADFDLSDEELNRKTSVKLKLTPSEDKQCVSPRTDIRESSKSRIHKSPARIPSRSPQRSRTSQSHSSRRSRSRVRSRSRFRSRSRVRTRSRARTRSRVRTRTPRERSKCSAIDVSTSDHKSSRGNLKSKSEKGCRPTRDGESDVLHIKKELSSFMEPAVSHERSFGSRSSVEKDQKKLILQKEISCNNNNANLFKIKDNAIQNIMLRQKAFVEEISSDIHITLSKEEWQSIMNHLLERVKDRIRKLKLPPTPKTLLDDVIICYRRYYNEDDDKTLIKALLKEFPMTKLNDYFENINSPESENVEEDTIDWQEIDEVLKDIDMDKMLNKEDSQIKCKIEMSGDEEPGDKTDSKCHEPEITQKQYESTHYPNNSWYLAENSKYDLFRNKSVKRKKKLDNGPSDTGRSKEDFADKKIISKPKFVITVNTLLKSMKSIINNKYDGQIEGEKFIGIIKKKLQKKIRKLLAGKSYMKSSDITTLYRLHYPKKHDEKFIDHIVRDIKCGKYNNFAADDKDRNKVKTEIDTGSIITETIEVLDDDSENKIQNTNTNIDGKAQITVKNDSQDECDKDGVIIIDDNDDVVIITDSEEELGITAEDKITKSEEHNDPTSNTLQAKSPRNPVREKNLDSNLAIKKEDTADSDCTSLIQIKEEREADLAIKQEEEDSYDSDSTTIIETKKEREPNLAIKQEDCDDTDRTTVIKIKEEREPNVQIIKENPTTDVPSIKIENDLIRINGAEPVT